MVSFLLDTNALAEPLRPMPHAGFMERLREHRLEVRIASVTWHEALFGLERMPRGARERAVREFLFDIVAPWMEIVSYDAPAAAWHAKERARLAAGGRTVPFADGQIAAIAATRSLTLVTANTKDFAPFEGLSVENWARR